MKDVEGTIGRWTVGCAALALSACARPLGQRFVGVGRRLAGRAPRVGMSGGAPSRRRRARGRSSDVRACVVVAVAALALAGCHRSHGRSERATDAGGAATPGDAGRGVDASADAAVALPRGPVDDPGPDARPSDEPEAAEWEAAPDLDPDAPCCDPAGAPTDIPIGRDPVGDVALEWNGDGWGLLYASISPRPAFQELTRDGAAVGPLRRFDVTGLGARLVWSGGRFGTLVVREGGGEQDSVFALLDRRGVVDAGWTDLSSSLPAIGARLARVDHRDRWIVVQSHFGPVRAVEIDAAARVVGAAEIADRGNERSDVVGLKSRAAAFWRTNDGLFARALTLPIDAVDTPVVHVTSAPTDQLASTRLRDRAVVISEGEGVGEALVGTFDPFTGETTEARVALARIGATPGDVVGLDVPGLLAMCTVDHGAGDIGVELRVFLPDGTLVGAPVRVGEDARANCAVGAQGDTIFVAWPRRYDGVVRVQGYRLRRAGP